MENRIDVLKNSNLLIFFKFLKNVILKVLKNYNKFLHEPIRSQQL